MVSRQFNHAESLSGSQKQSNPTEWTQNSLILLSFYLGLKVVYSYQVLLFQNRSKRVHTSGPIVLGNSQRPVPSNQYTLANTDDLLVSDLRHLASNPDPY